MQTRKVIDEALPRAISDRGGWSADIAAAFLELSIPPTRENACAVTAVIEQESGFQVEPIIPNLGRIALHALDQRAAHAGIPAVLVRAALELRSADGRTYLNPELGARLAAEPPTPSGPPDDLSARELEVLKLIALGHTNGEIAATLYLSVRTVESHRAHIQQKTRRTTRADLVAYAREHKLLT